VGPSQNFAGVQSEAAPGCGGVRATGNQGRGGAGPQSELGPRQAPRVNSVQGRPPQCPRPEANLPCPVGVGGMQGSRGSQSRYGRRGACRPACPPRCPPAGSSLPFQGSTVFPHRLLWARVTRYKHWCTLLPARGAPQGRRVLRRLAARLNHGTARNGTARHNTAQHAYGANSNASTAEKWEANGKLGALPPRASNHPARALQHRPPGVGPSLAGNMYT
jgi:hypothetical protein